MIEIDLIHDTPPKAAEWHEALGGVPLHRIWLHPLPGTATVEDAVSITERYGPVELVDGTIVEKAIGATESRIGVRIAARLTVFVEERELGATYGADCTLRMPTGNMRMPDVSFIVTDRVPDTAVKAPPVCPDLVVEVLSEDNTEAEIRQKLRELFGGGTRLAWIVDHRARTVAVHTSADTPDVTLTDADTLDGGDVLPGFELPVADLFRGI